MTRAFPPRVSRTAKHLSRSIKQVGADSGCIACAQAEHGGHSPRTTDPMGQGVLLRIIGRLRERRMHNQSPSQFTLATIGSACIFGLLSITWTPAQATPCRRPTHGWSCRPGCLNSFRNETWSTHGQPPVARGVEPWRADRVEQWPADLRAEWPPAGLMVGPPHAARQAMSRFVRVTGHLGRRAAGIGHRPTGGAPALRSPQAQHSAS